MAGAVPDPASCKLSLLSLALERASCRAVSLLPLPAPSTPTSPSFALSPSFTTHTLRSRTHPRLFPHPRACQPTWLLRRRHQQDRRAQRPPPSPCSSSARPPSRSRSTPTKSGHPARSGGAAPCPPQASTTRPTAGARCSRCVPISLDTLTSPRRPRGLSGVRASTSSYELNRCLRTQVAPNTGGLGEPLNVIISGNSDEAVLVDSEDNGGFRNYML